jgi:hypothetical protein
MSEERDKTTEPATDPPRNGARVPAGYYYDDGTGYEVYAPEDDEAEETADDARDEEA